MIELTFLAPPDQNVELLAAALVRSAGGLGEMAPQREAGEDVAIWATGWVELGSVRFLAFLANQLIAAGFGVALTAAEREHVDRRGGRSDVYQLRLTCPSRHDGVKVDEAMARRDAEAFLDDFSRSVAAIPPGRSSAWSDYATVEKK